MQSSCTNAPTKAVKQLEAAAAEGKFSDCLNLPTDSPYREIFARLEDEGFEVSHGINNPAYAYVNWRKQNA